MEAQKAKDTSKGGIGFGGVLTIVFVVLKLLSIGPVASWSWWWVLAPLWAPTALILVIGIIVLLVGAVYESHKTFARKREKKKLNR